jgi:hypothetical protein
MGIWSAENRVDPFPALVRQAVARKVEVIVVLSTPGALAAEELATGIPSCSRRSATPREAVLWRASRDPAAMIMTEMFKNDELQKLLEK